MRPRLSICIFLALACLALQAIGRAAEPPASPYETAARSRLQLLATNQSNVRYLRSLTNLPPAIREKLVAVADAGKPFSAGCTGNEPHARFLLASRTGQTYNVALEQGGIVYTWSILQFILDPEGKIIQQTRIPRDDASPATPPSSSKTNRPPSTPSSRPAP